MPPSRKPLEESTLVAILRPYQLKLRSYRPILAGSIGSNYHVETDAGPLFLRVSRGRREADLRFECELIWHLGSRGLSTPPLFRTREGAPYVLLPPPEGITTGLLGTSPPRTSAQLFSWVDGDEHTDAEIDASRAREAGATLALLHLGAGELRERRPGQYTLAQTLRRLTRLKLDVQAMIDLSAVLEELSLEAARLSGARRADLPHGVGHNDLFPDNLLYLRHSPRPSVSHVREQRTVLLDLEQAAVIPYVYDVAVGLIAFCAPMPVQPEAEAESGADSTQSPVSAVMPPLSIDGRLGPLLPVTARAFLDGYQELRVLGDLEWQGLYEELRYAALRFTVTRLIDVHGYTHAEVTPVLRLPPPTSRHRKDFADMLWRLRSLMAIGEAALLDSLR